MSNKLEKSIQSIIDWGKENVPDFNENSLSDGYHTFDELYDFRKMYNALLFNEWAKMNEFLVIDISQLPDNFSLEDFNYKELLNSQWSNVVHDSESEVIPNNPKYNVHKSLRHHDGELCFGGGWFIVSAMLPTGLISNHYKMADWDLFQVPEVEKALFEFDGHTGKDVLERMKNLIKT